MKITPSRKYRKKGRGSFKKVEKTITDYLIKQRFTLGKCYDGNIQI